ncbi:hypothetical protein ACHAXH_004239 [Discostella pseudostelligera]
MLLSQNLLLAMPANQPSPSAMSPTHAKQISNKGVKYALSPDQKVKADANFLAWKAKKEKKHNGDEQGEWSRRLGGCGDCVNWDTTMITIPTYIHVIHSGTTGKQYTYASNPAYIQNQIKVLNIGFRGDVSTAFTPFASRSYPRYEVPDTNANIQFCLAGTTAPNNAAWYLNVNDIAMKTALNQGGPESFECLCQYCVGISWLFVFSLH